jgi:molybdate transport system substrate-binding protein
VSPSSALAALVLGLSLSVANAQEPVQVYAAGSLRAALTEAARAFRAAHGLEVALTFGPSGLLAERIDGGERAEVFASADMGNPSKLWRSAKSGPVVRFAGNRLCALAAQGLTVTTADLLERMMDPAVKLGISTPGADPSGDYAIQLFEKADRMRAGAYRVLAQKARKLTGGPASLAPAGRSAYGALIDGGQADIFLTYCTNALQAKAENPRLQVIDVPAGLAVGADYGMTVLRWARPQAERFARYLLSKDGQAILVRHGFAPAAGS